MTRGLKFRIKVKEGLYCPYSENKGAAQLLFSHMQKAGFLIMWLKLFYQFNEEMLITIKDFIILNIKYVIISLAHLSQRLVGELIV